MLEGMLEGMHAGGSMLEVMLHCLLEGWLQGPC